MTTLEERIQRLEDIEAIKQLKAEYCAYCDDGYNPDAIAKLYTEDAVWDGGESLGRCDGREAIREFFQGAPKMISFAIHNVLNPRIEVHGDTATGVWYLLQPMTTAPKNEAVWLTAVYHDRYRKVGGTWMFEHVEIEVRFMSPHEEGWAKTPLLEL